MVVSLVTTVRNKFLEAIRSVQPQGRWKILVVDLHSQKLLNSVLKRFDILEENVTDIQLITNPRDPQPEFEAMYLLMPTSQNVDRVVRDFSNRQQYGAAHLFFIDGLSDELLQRLTSSQAEPYLAACKELFLNIWATEAQTFALNDPGLFFSLYSPPRTEAAYKAARDRLEEDLMFTSKMIANVCITLNEFPYIRYYMPAHHLPLGPLKPNKPAQTQGHSRGQSAAAEAANSRWRTQLARGAEARASEAADTEFVTRLLAFYVQRNLEEHQKLNPDFGKDSARQRGTLLITDRSMDMLSPFIHEFTYQAMANDLLRIENGTKYMYKFQSAVGAYEDKTAVLSDADTVWTEVRHMHMREAIDKLMSDFNKFLVDNAVFKGEGAANLNDMKEMLANLPQYQEQREAFSLHLSMAQDCMAIFEKDKLPLIANVEQCCSTGLNSDGKVPKSLVEEMVPLLDSREVANINKVRIVALYIQYRDGVPDEDRRRLYQHARLTLAEQDAVNALVHMGVRISRGPGDKDRKNRFKQKASNEEEYELSRYKPAIRTLLEDHVNDRLETALFPYVRDAPSSLTSTTSLRSPPPQTTSLRSQKPAWHRARPTQQAADNKQRVIVFVAGGMTYSETREVYQLSQSLNKDIFIGSTHVVTPRGFVDDLKVLDLGGAGSKAIPNGLIDRRDGQRPWQAIYDEKYYTQDALPPPRQQAPQPTASRLQQTFSHGSHSSSSHSQSVLHKPIQPSPTPSYSSYSGQPIVEEKKKKKRGLFGF